MKGGKLSQSEKGKVSRKSTHTKLQIRICRVFARIFFIQGIKVNFSSQVKTT